MSTSLNEELLEGPAYASHAPKSSSATSCVPALISPPHHDDDDLRPLTSGLGCLDFDPMGFQSSGPSGDTDRPPGRKQGRSSHGNGTSDAQPSVSSPSDNPTSVPAATVISLHSPDNSPAPIPGPAHFRLEEELGDDEEEAGLNPPTTTPVAAAVLEEGPALPVADPRLRADSQPGRAVPVAVPDSVSSTPLTSSPSLRSEALPSETSTGTGAPNRAGSKRSGSCSADCRASAMEPKQNRPDPGERRTRFSAETVCCVLACLRACVCVCVCTKRAMCSSFRHRIKAAVCCSH